MSPIKIYFDNFPLIIADHDIPEILGEETLVLDKRKTAISIIEEHFKHYQRAFIKVKKYPKSLLKIFRDYTTVLAAGGLVRNQKGDILLIFRKGHWDMAKGHLETGESLEQCAMREVSEETGLKNLELIRPLGVTYHTYFRKKNILKENYWYQMEVTEEMQLVPQKEEGIDEVKWVSPMEIEEYFDNMFPSIRDIIQQFIHQMDILMKPKGE